MFLISIPCQTQIGLDLIMNIFMAKLRVGAEQLVWVTVCVRLQFTKMAPAGRRELLSEMGGRIPLFKQLL
jgi:hypothetical protein